MKYQETRSVCYNMARVLDIENSRFSYFHAKEIVKFLRSERNVAVKHTYDVLLGIDSNTVAIVSVKFIHGSIDIMVSSSSLEDLGVTFEDIVNGGLDASWALANAKYFNSKILGSKFTAICKAAIYLRKVMKGE